MNVTVSIQGMTDPPCEFDINTIDTGFCDV